MRYQSESYVAAVRVQSGSAQGMLVRLADGTIVKRWQLAISDLLYGHAETVRISPTVSYSTRFLDSVWHGSYFWR